MSHGVHHEYSLDGIAVLHTGMRPIVTDRVAWCVGLYVYLSVCRRDVSLPP